MELQFGDFSLNTETYELRDGAEPVAVEPLVFDLLNNFASHPQEVFSREELIESVWKGRIVSDATISTCVKNARKALGDTGDAQTYLQTVRGRGYRFNAVVTETAGTAKQRSAPTSRTTAPLPADPSLLILPFRCLTDDAELQVLAGGVTLNLNTILTRIPLLNISAEGNSFRDNESQPSALQAHEQCGVDFVLDGSVQKSAGAARINAQLADAKTGYRLWADTFELPEPLTVALDNCVSAIVAKVEPQLHRAMYQRVCAADDQPTARQLFLEASGLLVMHGWNHESFIEAGDILVQSAKLDPRFPLPQALLSLMFGFGSRIGLMVDKAQAEETAKNYAEQALKLDSMDSTILGLTGCALADIGEMQRGESLLNAAIDINSANAQAWVALGAVRLAQYDAPAAIEKLSRGISISPMDSRLSVWGSLLSIAHLLNSDLDTAVETAEIACRRHDRTYLPRISLAASRCMQGDSQRAKQAMTDARRIKPDLSLEQISGIAGRKLSPELEKL